MMPDEALKALAEAARTGDDEQEAEHIAESRTAAERRIGTGAQPGGARTARTPPGEPSSRQLALRAFVGSAEDRKRLEHMLGTLRGRRGGGPPDVAGRLMTMLRGAAAPPAAASPAVPMTTE
ncbi:hypothetical protein ABZ686_00395 [Streptomyces sp. NPDC006992]|uniref:hypothetical protein n=1 Tax=unclassified Streptomyces TaxID=2593676 RepID=UPI0033C26301